MARRADRTVGSAMSYQYLCGAGIVLLVGLFIFFVLMLYQAAGQETPKPGDKQE